MDRFATPEMPPSLWEGIKRLIEAWVYILVLVVVAVVCFVIQTWWPLYPAVGLLVLLAYHRRI